MVSLPHRLAVALAPASIAIIGASDNKNKVGGRPLHFLKRFGYRGAIFPINPNRAEVQGVRAYANLDQLPETPELAVIAVAGDEALVAVRACAKRGVACAIVISSGFGETDDAGKRAQNEMLAAARASGMRLIGPNTQGLANFANGAVTSFSTMFIEVPPQDGPIAIVSQSGAASVVPYAQLRARGLGVRYVLASGNDADVSVSELALAVAQDPDIKLILLYAESIRDADSLAQAARIARQRTVPMVALKAARGRAGQSAAQSHTGALANEDRVIDAFFERHGIWRAQDSRGLTNAAELYLQAWRCRGNRLAVISNSGAMCVLAADTAERLGLPLAQLAAETRDKLAAILPAFATTTNPIDLTAALLTNSGLFGAVLPVLGADADVDLVFIAIPVAGEGYDVTAFARDTAAFTAAAQKPVAVTAPQQNVRSAFQALGVPAFETETDALAALHQFAAHTALLASDVTAARATGAVSIPAGDERFLSEADSLAVLERAGLPAVQFVLCRDENDALVAFHSIGAPVAVKACSAQLPHKAEHALVRLNCRSEKDVRTAFREIGARVQGLGVASEGLIVARMVRGYRELMLGAKVDAVFGPVVIVGDGGKFVEAMPDHAVLLAPFDEREAASALQRLRIAPLFAGVRGEPAWDVEALCSAAVRLGDLMIGARGQIASVDCNPVMIGARGEGVMIVDALIERIGDT